MNHRVPRLSKLARAYWLLAMCLMLSVALPATAEENDTIAAEPASAENAGQSGEAGTETDDDKETTKPEESRPAVQPELEAATEGPPEIKLPDAETADIRQQIRSLRTSLDQRQVAVDSTRNRLTYAESLLNRLQDEYNSFELRLEKAGLNLTGDYAGLLQQRLERLRRQEIAEDLIRGIED
ncbi:MAG: hypothetical protein ACPHQ9_07785, partial [Marinobacter sp.]